MHSREAAISENSLVLPPNPRHSDQVLLSLMGLVVLFITILPSRCGPGSPNGYNVETGASITGIFPKHGVRINGVSKCANKHFLKIPSQKKKNKQNSDTMTQNLWYAAKAVLKEGFIAIQSFCCYC